MAFPQKKRHKEQVDLVSLIDMLFILLVFFLVTSFVIRLPLQERGIAVPTPENKPGRAQIVIQFLDESRVFWLDESASATVMDIENRQGYRSRSSLNRLILDRLLNNNTLQGREFERRLNGLIDQADRNPNASFFVMIRSPNRLPYSRVVEVIAKLTDTKFGNIQYGCVAGTLDDIRSSRKITTVTERDDRGRMRRSIQIDF